MSWLSKLLYGDKPQVPDAPQLSTSNELTEFTKSQLKNAYETGGFPGEDNGTRDALDNLLNSVTGRIADVYDKKEQGAMDQLAKRGMSLAGSNMTKQIQGLRAEEAGITAETTANLEYEYLKNKEQRREEIQKAALTSLYNIGMSELGLVNQQATLDYNRQLQDYENAMNERSSKIGLMGNVLTLGGMSGWFGKSIQSGLLRR